MSEPDQLADEFLLVDGLGNVAIDVPEDFHVLLENESLDNVCRLLIQLTHLLQMYDDWQVPILRRDLLAVDGDLILVVVHLAIIGFRCNDWTCLQDTILGLSRTTGVRGIGRRPHVLVVWIRHVVCAAVGTCQSSSTSSIRGPTASSAEPAHVLCASIPPGSGH